MLQKRRALEKELMVMSGLNSPPDSSREEVIPVPHGTQTMWPSNLGSPARLIRNSSSRAILKAFESGPYMSSPEERDDDSLCIAFGESEQWLEG